MPISKKTASQVQFMTPFEVAKLLNVSRNTVRRMFQRLNIEPVRWNHTMVRYKESDVMRLIAFGEQKLAKRIWNKSKAKQKAEA